MGDDILIKLVEHNQWANLQIIQACSTLSDEQLDAPPKSATRGSIRQTLAHITEAEEAYLAFLLGREERSQWQAAPTMMKLQEAARISGEGFVDLVGGDISKSMHRQLRLSDGWMVQAWLIILQALNHATEHREQVKSMLSSLGVTPPEVDGWSYGTVANAAIPPPT